jgi:FkbM family methyltransferase
MLTFKAKFQSASEVKQDIFGFKVFANSPQTLLLLFREIFIEEVYFFTSEKVNPKIIDCGANMGLTVLYFKYLYPQAQIAAIEPNPQALFYLEKNISQNQLQDVQVKNVCLSDRIGKEKFYFSPNISIANGSLFSEIGKEYLLEVDAALLSDVLSESFFDLVKIDVEGAERQIFNDLKSSGQISKSNRYIIEYHQSNDLEDIFSEMLTTFSDEGFEYSVSGEGGDKMVRFELSSEL